MLATQNPLLSPAVNALGMNPLQQQMAQEDAERKKKLLDQAKQMGGLPPATSQLFGMSGSTGGGTGGAGA